MKKQKKMGVEATPIPTSKKKRVAKREIVDERQSLEVEENKEGEGGGRAEGSPTMAATVVVGEEDWRPWWRPEVLVDEQMSWGSVWFSFWEQDHHNAFYSDVLEEDDLWNLRSINQVPQ